MRFFEYLLKFGFMYGVGLGLLLVLAPLMWESAQEAKINHEPNTRLQQLELFIPDPQTYGAERYLRLELVDAQGQKYQTTFFLPEGGHQQLVQVLENHNLISSSQNLVKELPVVVKHNDQQELLSAVYLDIKENRISQLRLGGEVVIGNAGYGRQIFLYLLTALFGIAGIAGLALTTYALAGNLNLYKQTGRLPDLPNSVQSKWEGLKYLLRGFNN